MTIIVGRNNAGKSTIAEALRLLSIIVSRYKGLQFFPAPKWLDLPKRTRGVSPSLANMEFNFETVFHRYGDPPAVIVANFEGGEKITVYIGLHDDVYATITDKTGSLITTKGDS